LEIFGHLSHQTIAENLKIGLPEPKLDFGPPNALLLSHHDLYIIQGTPLKSIIFKTIFHNMKYDMKYAMIYTCRTSH